ncbi:MAG: SDR family NAD(P)-dependent oxidoreductase [Arthrobacter sp.]|uniref:SDR family NAD(P)-dependent oxidoreductase n=1 Tax=Arthrobacter sp. TaxID=1667 RepID=UPI00348CBABA
MGNVSFDFTGRTLLLTGATGGIGRRTAELFHAAGANLVLLDLNEGALRAMAGDLGGDRVEVVAGDAGAEDRINTALGAARERFGRLDYVVPAAGIYPEASLVDTDDELWRRVMSINLDGVFRLLRASVPVLADGGAVVNFASVAGHRGSKKHGHYAASKAAIIALTRSLALECDRGIRVNAVSPGTIETPMVEALVRDRGDKMLSETPLRRNGQPEEVAAVVAFLCSDAASFITGETVHVNGGLFMAG